MQIIIEWPKWAPAPTNVWVSETRRSLDPEMCARVRAMYLDENATREDIGRYLGVGRARVGTILDQIVAKHERRKSGGQPLHLRKNRR